MPYTIKDILDKLIEMENGMHKVYLDIADMNNDDFSSLKILCKVMSKEEKKHAEYFEKLKDSIGEEGTLDLTIDIDSYDKISQAIYQFKNNINIPSFEKVNELVGFLINFEKENLALLVNIRGNLIKKSEDAEKESYRILSILINEEANHVKSLAPYYKK